MIKAQESSIIPSKYCHDNAGYLFVPSTPMFPDPIMTMNAANQHYSPEKKKNENNNSTFVKSSSKTSLHSLLHSPPPSSSLSSDSISTFATLPDNIPKASNVQVSLTTIPHTFPLPLPLPPTPPPSFTDNKEKIKKIIEKNNSNFNENQKKIKNQNDWSTDFKGENQQNSILINNPSFLSSCSIPSPLPPSIATLSSPSQSCIMTPFPASIFYSSSLQFSPVSMNGNENSDKSANGNVNENGNATPLLMTPYLIVHPDAINGSGGNGSGMALASSSHAYSTSFPSCMNSNLMTELTVPNVQMAQLESCQKKLKYQEKNRMAAMKFRSRKKQEWNMMIASEAALKRENEFLKNRIKILEEELMKNCCNRSDA